VARVLAGGAEGAEGAEGAGGVELATRPLANPYRAPGVSVALADLPTGDGGAAAMTVEVA
jgi:hypothetical protein